MQLPIQAKFDPGTLVATTHAAGLLTPGDVAQALARHLSGDWGELSEEDRVANEQALAEQERLLSAYTSTSGVKFWIITEWDRSYTTVLLPEDY